jgi:hypothetical protein
MEGKMELQEMLMRAEFSMLRKEATERSAEKIPEHPTPEK